MEQTKEAWEKKFRQLFHMLHTKVKDIRYPDDGVVGLSVSLRIVEECIQADRLSRQVSAEKAAERINLLIPALYRCTPERSFELILSVILSEMGERT